MKLIILVDIKSMNSSYMDDLRITKVKDILPKKIIRIKPEQVPNPTFIFTSTTIDNVIISK